MPSAIYATTNCQLTQYMIGEELSCKREPTNRAGRFAVAVTKDSSQLEVAILTHHDTSEQLSLRCRIWYDVCNVTQSVSVVGFVME